MTSEELFSRNCATLFKQDPVKQRCVQFGGGGGRGGGGGGVVVDSFYGLHEA